MHIFYRWKNSPNIWSTFVVFTKPLKVDIFPMGEKIVQSGPPGYITKMILGVFCKKQIKLCEKLPLEMGVSKILKKTIDL
jgi:hypothetical protein